MPYGPALPFCSIHNLLGLVLNKLPAADLSRHIGFAAEREEIAETPPIGGRKLLQAGDVLELLLWHCVVL